MAFGLPSIPNLPAAISAASLLVSDATAIGRLFGATSVQWGIFQKGKPVLSPDSMLSIEYKQDWRIADYPMEQGAFQSYNKVATPFDVKVRMSKGGSVAARAAFLAAVQKIAGSLNLYDVVTPEKTYTSVNISHIDYHRDGGKGARLMVLDIWLTEIRANTSGSFLNTSLPSGADIVSVGNVQAAIPSAAELTQVATNVIAPVTTALSNAIGVAGPALEGAVLNLSSALTTAVNSALPNVTSALATASTQLTSSLQALTPQLEAGLSTAMTGVSAAMNGLSGALPQITGAMTQIGQSLPASINFSMVGH